MKISGTMEYGKASKNLIAILSLIANRTMLNFFSF